MLSPMASLWKLSARNGSRPSSRRPRPTATSHLVLSRQLDGLASRSSSSSVATPASWPRAECDRKVFIRFPGTRPSDPLSFLRNRKARQTNTAPSPTSLPMPYSLESWTPAPESHLYSMDQHFVRAVPNPKSQHITSMTLHQHDTSPFTQWKGATM